MSEGRIRASGIWTFAPFAAVGAMRDAARGYDALATAARRRDRTRFLAARAQVSRSEAGLAEALAHLGA